MKILMLVILLSIQLFAIISIVPVEISQKPGLSGGVELGLNTKRGNTYKDSYTGSLLLNYDNNSSYVVWLEISGEYAKANNIVDTNKQYAHLRYIYALSDETLRGELFLQGQDDEFKALAKRRLAGGGLRAKIFETFTGGKGYIGLGGFYEYIRFTDSNLDPKEDNIRINSYTAYTIQFNEDSNLAYNLYYQPRINNFSDFVLSNKFELRIHVYLKIFLKFTIYYDYDSSPPQSILEKYDFGQSTTFIFDF